jgi:catechol 2,3-dioxygenase-like lactoylglutathione lyase family enzyme
MRVQLGPVAHFSLAVSDPNASAGWWTANFDLDEYARRGSRIVLGNSSVVLALLEGTPDPAANGHLAFHVADVATLESARDALRANGVELEDPGDEIGPVAPGSPSLGLWFHDLDGYRWELFVRVPESG